MEMVNLSFSADESVQADLDHKEIRLDVHGTHLSPLLSSVLCYAIVLVTLGVDV